MDVDVQDAYDAGFDAGLRDAYADERRKVVKPLAAALLVLLLDPAIRVHIDPMAVKQATEALALAGYDVPEPKEDLTVRKSKYQRYQVLYKAHPPKTGVEIALETDDKTEAERAAAKYRRQGEVRVEVWDSHTALGHIFSL